MDVGEALVEVKVLGLGVVGRELEAVVGEARRGLLDELVAHGLQVHLLELAPTRARGQVEGDGHGGLEGVQGVVRDARVRREPRVHEGGELVLRRRDVVLVVVALPAPLEPLARGLVGDARHLAAAGDAHAPLLRQRGQAAGVLAAHAVEVAPNKVATARDDVARRRLVQGRTRGSTMPASRALICSMLHRDRVSATLETRASCGSRLVAS